MLDSDMDNDGILDFNEFKVMIMTIVKGSFPHYVKGSDQGSPAEVERQRHGGGGKVVEGEIKLFYFLGNGKKTRVYRFGHLPLQIYNIGEGEKGKRIKEVKWHTLKKQRKF